jgi:hypothetical protein
MADPLEALVAEVDAFRAALRRSKAVNVNTEALRDSAKRIVQAYFRKVRPELIALRIDPKVVGRLDGRMQQLLGLSNGRNKKSTYEACIAGARKDLGVTGALREMALSEQSVASHAPVLSEIETRILGILDQLDPIAAASYRQALADLSDNTRLSYRGTANELRETLREVLDRLAPDEDVMQQPNFKLEKGQSRPTQKQKVRFILKSRGKGKTAREAPESTVELIDELTASVARSSYQRTSFSAHAGGGLSELRQLKMYVDTVLAELLEIHASTSD